MSLDYQALSYEWKSQEGSTLIYRDGLPVRVTQNLAAALYALRRPDKARNLWVDAICINQNDAREKSEQVRLMPRIYASARSVLVWLGLSFEGFAGAFAILPQLVRLAIERNQGTRPDNTTKDTWLQSVVWERPVTGSILRNKDALIHMSHDRDRSFHRTIPACTDLDDDAIFRFDDVHTWNAIDRIFANTYFYRSWIIQEIATAEHVTVLCGFNEIDWTTFSLAARGRYLLPFISTAGGGRGAKSNVPAVDDARHRYRSSMNGAGSPYDLARVLTSFAYSKESDAHDRVYAALGLVTAATTYEELVPDYTKSVEEVFLATARHIILDRKDLYLWSTKVFRPTRIRKLPTWVPEWDMLPCEEAIEFARPSFRECLRGDYKIENSSLMLGAHLVDQIDKIFTIKTGIPVIGVLLDLQAWLMARGRTLFSHYPAACPGSSHDIVGQTLMSSEQESRYILAEYRNLSNVAIMILNQITRNTLQTRKSEISNIEAIWSVLSSTTQRRFGEHGPVNHHLLLSMLFLYSSIISRKSFFPIDVTIPQRYRAWLMLSLYLLYTKEDRTLFYNTLALQFGVEHQPHWIEHSFFITRSGFLGHAPSSAVQCGQWVGVLGGAWCPYLLESHDQHWETVSHVYLEGIMTMRKLSSDCPIERLEIK